MRRFLREHPGADSKDRYDVLPDLFGVARREGRNPVQRPFGPIGGLASTFPLRARPNKRGWGRAVAGTGRMPVGSAHLGVTRRDRQQDGRCTRNGTLGPPQVLGRVGVEVAPDHPPVSCSSVHFSSSAIGPSKASASSGRCRLDRQSAHCEGFNRGDSASPSRSRTM